MTATLPHSDCAISCAVSGCSAISPRILRARRSCIAKRSSISAAWSPNGSPWPGRTRLDRHLARLAQRRHVDQQRARAAVAGLAGLPAERPRDQRVGGDVLDQVVAADQRRRSPRRRRPCPTASGPGRWSASQRAAGELELARRRRSRRVDRRAAAPAAERRATPRAARSRRRAGCRGAASAPRPARRRARRARRSPRPPARAGRARTTSAPERSREDADQPEVVEVLVGDDDPLEVLDPAAVLAQRALERVERLARVRARCRPASAGRPRSGSS